MFKTVLQASGGGFDQLVEWFSQPLSPGGASLYLVMLIIVGMVRPAAQHGRTVRSEYGLLERP
jgi:hypothetical protein